MEAIYGLEGRCAFEHEGLDEAAFGCRCDPGVRGADPSDRRGCRDDIQGEIRLQALQQDILEGQDAQGDHRQRAVKVYAVKGKWCKVTVRGVKGN
jgi:hypothetical protein